jgi:hypothetical protein
MQARLKDFRCCRDRPKSRAGWNRFPGPRCRALPSDP